jgi:hypothetical protein
VAKPAEVFHVSKDNKHFITHAATAMAVMALAECGALGKED